MVNLKILWVCKNTGNIAETEVNEVPAATTLADSYKHDWIPVEVVSA
jgi:hypothetical protein